MLHNIFILTYGIIFCHSSPGYGISLVAESTSGCFISADTAISRGRAEETSDFTDDDKNDLMPPENIGQQIALGLLEEIKQGGVVDSTHQVCILDNILFLLSFSFALRSIVLSRIHILDKVGSTVILDSVEKV